MKPSCSGKPALHQVSAGIHLLVQAVGAKSLALRRQNISDGDILLRLANTSAPSSASIEHGHLQLPASWSASRLRTPPETGRVGGSRVSGQDHARLDTALAPGLSDHILVRADFSWDRDRAPYCRWSLVRRDAMRFSLKTCSQQKRMERTGILRAAHNVSTHSDGKFAAVQ